MRCKPSGRAWRARGCRGCWTSTSRASSTRSTINGVKRCCARGWAMGWSDASSASGWTRACSTAGFTAGKNWAPRREVRSRRCWRTSTCTSCSTGGGRRRSRRGCAVRRSSSATPMTSSSASSARTSAGRRARAARRPSGRGRLSGRLAPCGGLAALHAQHTPRRSSVVHGVQGAATRAPSRPPEPKIRRLHPSIGCLLGPTVHARWKHRCL